MIHLNLDLLVNQSAKPNKLTLSLAWVPYGMQGKRATIAMIRMHVLPPVLPPGPNVVPGPMMSLPLPSRLNWCIYSTSKCKRGSLSFSDEMKLSYHTQWCRSHLFTFDVKVKWKDTAIIGFSWSWCTRTSQNQVSTCTLLDSNHQNSSWSELTPQAWTHASGWVNSQVVDNEQGQCWKMQ